MIEKPTVTELLTKAKNRYELVIMTARRARQIASGDKALTNVAQIKADDMVKNNYFSHTSSSYGSPFEMMQGFGISYKSAGENIAGNPSITDAVNSWLASSTHKTNLLSKNFNYIGIGLTKSNTYGYIIVAMFIQK